MSDPITIIAAGRGGLAAAMLLASQGRRVRILERLPRVGGRCSAIEENGFRFDLGPTFFLYPRVLKEVFASAGYDLFKEVPMSKLDPQYRIHFGQGGQLDATPDIQRMEAEIAVLSPQDAGAFTRFMNDNREKLRRFRPILESPFSSVFDLLRPSMLKAVPWLRPWHSVGSELQSYFADPRLVLAFSFQSNISGCRRFSVPASSPFLPFSSTNTGSIIPQAAAVPSVSEWLKSRRKWELNCI